MPKDIKEHHLIRSWKAAGHYLCSSTLDLGRFSQNGHDSEWTGMMQLLSYDKNPYLHGMPGNSYTFITFSGGEFKINWSMLSFHSDLSRKMLFFFKVCRFMPYVHWILAILLKSAIAPGVDDTPKALQKDIRQYSYVFKSIHLKIS